MVCQKQGRRSKQLNNIYSPVSTLQTTNVACLCSIIDEQINLPWRMHEGLSYAGRIITAVGSSLTRPSPDRKNDIAAGELGHTAKQVH